MRPEDVLLSSVADIMVGRKSSIDARRHQLTAWQNGSENSERRHGSMAVRILSAPRMKQHCTYIDRLTISLFKTSFDPAGFLFCGHRSLRQKALHECGELV